MVIIHKKIIVVILCFLIILTGFAIQNSKSKVVQESLFKPKEVIVKYFEYYNEKNIKGMNSLTTSNYHFSKSNWEVNNLKYIKVMKLLENKNMINKQIYIRSRKKNQIINLEAEKTELQNITIFKVTFKVKYKKDGIGPKDSGIYKYNYTLIRKDKNSPWLINSAGY